MTAGLGTLIVGLAVGAAVLGGPAPGQLAPAQLDACAEEGWEADAQALADELAGAPGADAEALRRELAEVGFEAGGPRGGTVASPPLPPGDRGWPEALVELVLAIVAALGGHDDGEVSVTVLDPSGAAPTAPHPGGGDATSPDCAAPPDGGPAPRSDPPPRPDPAPRPGAEAAPPRSGEPATAPQNRDRPDSDTPRGDADPPDGPEHRPTDAGDGGDGDGNEGE